MFSILLYSLIIQLIALERDRIMDCLQVDLMCMFVVAFKLSRSLNLRL